MTPRVRSRLATVANAVRAVNGWRITAIALAALLLAAAATPPAPPPSPQLLSEFDRLSGQVYRLQQERQMPMKVLERHRDSICFLYGIYSFSGPGLQVQRRMRISGTGFVAGEGLIATNRHVAEPWFEDPESQALIRRGARPKLEQLMAFFPSSNEGIPLRDVRVSPDADLAVARFDPARLPVPVHPLPLAEDSGVPGDTVVVVGYPMGTLAMVAKSPQAVYRRLASRRDGIAVARELAALSLIRPSATYGHLGDVVGDKLIYDAVTAHGGSGGPVFDGRGKVIGINAAYLDGFTGSTLGISVNALRPLLQAAAAGD